MHFCKQLLQLCLVVASGLGTAVGAQPANKTADSHSHHNLLRFADLPEVGVQSPALQANRQTYTNDAEIEQLLSSLPKASFWRYKSIFKTEQGRDIWMARFAKPSDASNGKRKLNVWIIGQQHGNEPAGCEAALDLIRRLATQGEYKDKLQHLNIFVVPRANPDGAAVGKRGNAKGVDPNRDHLSLQQPEVAALHRQIKDDLPDIVIDLHEFTVGGRWVKALGAVQASDVLLQSASHPMVDKQLRRLTGDFFEPQLTKALKKYQLRSFVYHTLNTENPDKPSFVQMGGNYAGIARNAFGLYGAVSYLIETRGLDIGRDHLQRRVATHVVAVKALLETAVTHRDAIASAVNKVRSSLPGMIVVDHEATREKIRLPMIDSTTGEDKDIEVDFQNSLVIKPTIERAVPSGYVLEASQTDAVNALRSHGVTVVSLGEQLASRLSASAMSAERYTVQEIKRLPGEFGASPSRIKVSTQTEAMVFKPGMFYIGLNQPLARIAFMALEPESAGSFASVGILNMGHPGAPAWQAGDKLPLWRLTTAAPKPLSQ